MQVLLHHGQSPQREFTLEEIIADLRAYAPQLHAVPIDALIEFMDAAATALTAKAGAGVHPLRPLGEFMRSDALSRMLKLALRGDYHVLDSFIAYPETDRLLHCQPRGLAVHWLAGNVSVLGLYSFIQTLLTKNVSILKASHHGYDELLALLALLRSVRTRELDGEDLCKAVSVVLVDNTDRISHEKLSRAADIRIAWGGEESVTAIQSLPRAYWCEDIIYGPKYSLAAIDKESLANHRAAAQRLAFDICMFDQYACSSPHTVFIEEGGPVTIQDFGKELATALETVSAKFLPKRDSDPGRSAAILATRAKYQMTGTVFASPSLEWTVVISKEEGLAEPVFSRVVFLRSVDDLHSIARHIDRRKQTLGIALLGEHRKELLDALTLSGVDRCPPFGEMTRFESPWDGMFSIDRMVRWVSASKDRI